ncbi:hypothetical protein AK812_SmicGene9282 [Symbiodinium microadriaticum]|uniref:Uncharacterized protein n=1 Tax=Symbiodinium microadriaticum TaxID=2951 RepID=A0A1Q9EIP7_SYMMI|nr:hypothetical protein AK812_SmicGene9282 [Symbiodinium microadriaticum]
MVKAPAAEPKLEGYWRVRRYLQSDAKGQAKCSKEMLELGATSEGREKIRKVLMEKGSFDKVELVVKQWHESKTRDETSGGYVTKKWLMDNKSFTQCRKNVITGEEEADIPLDERWSVMRERGQRMEFENGCELDDPDASLLEELCFPTLQQNVSPTSILPSFITVLGRKLDNGDDAKDKCRQTATARIADQIEASVKKMQKIYDELLKLQAEAATAKNEEQIKIEEAILAKFVDATKEDLALNNHVQRSKQPVFKYRFRGSGDMDWAYGKPEDSDSSDDLFEELMEGLTLVQELHELPTKLQRKYGEQVGETSSWNDWAGVRGAVPVMLAAIFIGLRNKQERIVGWPVLRMSDWARCALGRGGQMMDIETRVFPL